MNRELLTKIGRWFLGPFRNRRMAVFWLISGLAIGSTSAWLLYLSSEKAAEEDGAFPLYGPAPACDVLDVHDGDTLKLDCGWQEDKPRILSVRLYCIDAPELDQEPWGKLARDHLRELAGKVVAIEGLEKDRHHRLVARVAANGEELNLKMVSGGFAAVYPSYCRDQRYYDAQKNTRNRRAGIWSVLGQQQRPWEWRKQ